MIFHIAARELRSLFLSPLAWTVLAIIQFLAALVFAKDLEIYLVSVQPQLVRYSLSIGVTHYVVSPMYEFIAIVMLFTIPLLTMRTISEEKRSKSIVLLFSAPLSMTEIIIGKYLGIVAYLIIMILLITIMPLSLTFAGNLDYGMFGAVLLGITLYAAAVAAMCTFMSSLTSQPMIAAILGFGVGLLLWILQMVGGNSTGDAVNLPAYISIVSHWQSFGRGIFNTSDFAYYILFITIFIVLSIRRLDGDRLQR